MLPLINKYIPIALIIIFTSYQSNLNGKIETRESNKVYIVNTSENNAFKFTLKTVSVTDDSIRNYRTDIIELAPGDEKYIGVTNELILVNPPSEQIIVDTTIITTVDDLPDLRKDKPPLPTGYTELLPPPIKKTRIKYTYKVTGQLKLSALTTPKKHK